MFWYFGLTLLFLPISALLVFHDTSIFRILQSRTSSSPRSPSHVPRRSIYHTLLLVLFLSKLHLSALFFSGVGQLRSRSGMTVNFHATCSHFDLFYVRSVVHVLALSWPFCSRHSVVLLAMFVSSSFVFSVSRAYSSCDSSRCVCLFLTFIVACPCFSKCSRKCLGTSCSLVSPLSEITVSFRTSACLCTVSSSSLPSPTSHILLPLSHYFNFCSACVRVLPCVLKIASILLLLHPTNTLQSLRLLGHDVARFVLFFVL